MFRKFKVWLWREHVSHFLEFWSSQDFYKSTNDLPYFNHRNQSLICVLCIDSSPWTLRITPIVSEEEWHSVWQNFNVDLLLNTSGHFEMQFTQMQTSIQLRTVTNWTVAGPRCLVGTRWMPSLHLYHPFKLSDVGIKIYYKVFSGGHLIRKNS